MTTALWAVLPGGIDDPAAPSGGNRYDREVLARLGAEHGFAVRETLLDGSWPDPEPAARRALDAALRGVPDGSDVLLDGLVACGVPDALRPHAARLRLTVLVHLPLGDETGLSPGEAARLRGRERAALHLARTVVATSEQAARHVCALHDLREVVVAEPGADLPGSAMPGSAAAGSAAAGGAAIGGAAIGGGAAPVGGGAAGRPGGRLLCVASVRPRKGQDLLVAALEGHLADLAWTCTFVGAVTEPVGHRHPGIRFTGPLAGDALEAAYRESDLLVLPSRAETYGMVVTEALARCLPVVATAVGGVPQALGRAPGGDLPGALVPPGDPQALAAALRAWLTDAPLRKRWRAAAAARRATLPSWNTTAATIAAAVRRGHVTTTE